MNSTDADEKTEKLMKINWRSVRQGEIVEGMKVQDLNTVYVLLSTQLMPIALCLSFGKKFWNIKDSERDKLYQFLLGRE